MNTQSELDRQMEIKLRAYERAHATWMNTSVFNEEAKTRVEAALKIARDEYKAAYAAANPTHTVC